MGSPCRCPSPRGRRWKTRPPSGRPGRAIPRRRPARGRCARGGRARSGSAGRFPTRRTERTCSYGPHLREQVPPRVDDVDAAGDTGVEGMDGPEDLDRLGGIGHGRVQEGFLVRPAPAPGVPRAPARPSVENSASGPTPGFLSTSPTSSLTRVWPEAYATSIRESGPTSIGRPSYRGAFSQLYFAVPSSFSL